MCDLNGAVGLGSRLMGQAGCVWRMARVANISCFFMHSRIAKLQKVSE